MKNKKSKYLICDKCRWIYFGVSIHYAENEVKEFNFYYDKLKPEDQIMNYGGEKAHMASYCFCKCGSLFSRMRPLKKTEKLPFCSTIGPILDPKQVKYNNK